MATRWPSAELDFVIRASAPAPAALTAQHVTDWPRVCQLAEQQRVLPRVWHNAAPLIPEPSASSMREQAAAQARRNLALLARTIDAVQLLANSDVEAVVLKGPWLAQRLYGDYGLRCCVDVDLLVQPHEFARAARAFARAGYQHDTPLDDATLARHLRTQHDLAFTHPQDGTLIELHADVAQPHYAYQMPLPEWWQQRRRIKTGGHELTVLNDEHAFLLAVLHAAKHRWHRLDLIADLTAFSSWPLDWSMVRASVQRTGMVRALETGLALSAHFYSETPPDTRPLVRQLALRAVQGSDASRWAGIWLDLQLRERWRDRVRYLYGRALRPTLQ